MAKHTPGPWESWGDSTIRWPDAKDRLGRKTLVEVCTVDLPRDAALRSMRAAGLDVGYGSQLEVRAANARLIAAAPTLLERLKHRVETCDCQAFGQEPQYLCVDCKSDQEFIRTVEGD